MVFIFTNILILCLKFIFTSQLIKVTRNDTSDLSNIVIRASIGEFLNHTGNFEQSMKDLRTRREDPMSKFNYGLFMLLQEMHNFSYRIILINDDKSNENGSIKNILQSFDNNETDISICETIQTVSNTDLVTFLMPFGHFRMCFFFKVKHSSILSFSKPFSKGTWWTLVIYSLAIILFLKVSFLLTASEESSWSFSVLVVLATLFQQDLSYFPSGVGSRIIFLSLLIMSLLLFNYYTSIMVSLLLNAEPYTFNTVDELVKSKLEIAIENHSYTRWPTKQDNIQQIVKKMSSFGNPNMIKTYSLNEGILKISSDELIYYADAAAGYEKIGQTFTQDVVCDFSEVQMVPSVPVGMVLPKQSQLFEPFQISLFRLREIGLVHRLQKIWIAEKPPCFSNPSIIAPVGMENVGVAFVYLIIGLLLAMLFLVYELR